MKPHSSVTMLEPDDQFISRVDPQHALDIQTNYEWYLEN
jgi:hypothetical protein